MVNINIPLPVSCASCPLSVRHFGKLYCPPLNDRVGNEGKDSRCPLHESVTINDTADKIKVKALEEPQWIPWNSGKPPEESGTYAVTAYDGTTKRVTYAKYQKRLKRWELTGARAYWRVLAWMSLPEPWGGDAE